VSRPRAGGAVVALLLALAVGLMAPGRAWADLPTPTGPSSDPAAVGQKADQILAQPEYRPPEKSIGDVIREKITELLGKTIQALSGGGAGSIVGWIIIAALVAVVLFFVIRVARTTQRSPEQPVEVSIEVRRSPTEWRAEAERYEAEGQWKEALRCRYRATVSDLIARKVVPDIPGRTVGEHRVDVRTAAPDADGPFNGATELFEQAWYGNRATGAAENARFRTLTDEVLQEVDR
jgi:Domain of unknown function (DUF4129)